MESLIRPKIEPPQGVARSAGPETLSSRRSGRSRGRESVALAAAPESAPLERLLIREQGRLVVVRLTEVDWIEGAGNYVRLHVGARSFLYRQTLAQLEARLDAARFTRIHRSTIVNLERIAELRPTISGSYDVLLLGGERLTLSRGHRRRALELVGNS